MKEIGQRLKEEALNAKEQRRDYNSLVRAVKSNCHQDNAGELAVTYQLEHIISNGVGLRGLGLELTVSAYREGIERFRNKKNDKL